MWRRVETPRASRPGRSRVTGPLRDERHMADLDILVVEDDELLRKGIHDRLKKQYYQAK